MSPRRAHRAAIAVASDGSILLNVVELLPVALLASLKKTLGGGEVFVGLTLKKAERAAVVSKLDGAAAEASAHLLGAKARASGGSRARTRR
jgi:hypothetical protein